jgi:Mannosyltransferase (PIG-V)
MPSAEDLTAPPRGVLTPGSQPSPPASAAAARRIAADAATTPLSIFAGSRLAIFAWALLFVGLIPVMPSKQPGFLGAFLRWDGGWYTGIAKSGYHWVESKQSSVAFFPLYPLTAKVTGILVGDVRLALFLVSNVAFLFYLSYLYRLAKRDFDVQVAERSILYVAIFPLSFFFSCGYSESLMLALATASFYYAREGRWARAITLGALTTLTRFAGIAIVLPLAWEWFKQKGIAVQALWLALVPAGLGLYMLYLAALTGNPLAFYTAQKAWDRSLTWPWGTFGIAWGLVTTLPLTRYITAIAFVDFGCIVGFLALSLAAIRLMPPAYWLYSLPLYFLSTSSTLDPTKGLPTASIGRYLMSIFPAFILLGRFGANRYVHYALLFLFAVLLGPLMLYFFAGAWVE